MISGSAPGATTSTSRVDSLRSGRASGSGGTAGPMEEVKRDKTEIRVVEGGRERVETDSYSWREDEEEGMSISVRPVICNKVG